MRFAFALSMILVLFGLTATAQEKDLKVSGRKIIGGSMKNNEQKIARALERPDSVSRARPLFIIDGIVVEESEVNCVNPEDIESISILKENNVFRCDGASKGVIIITTKKAKRKINV